MCGRRKQRTSGEPQHAAWAIEGMAAKGPTTVESQKAATSRASTSRCASAFEWIVTFEEICARG